MPCFVCATCGVQHAESEQPPASCPICEDERQYLPPGGQQWTTLEELRADHSNRIEEQEPRLTGIGSDPSFAIGQRALLVQTPAGNILWDCITLIDDETVTAVAKLGGLTAIAISHPHYYSAMVEWAHRFDCPVLLHEADSAWIMRPDPAIERVVAALEPFEFDRIYGAWWGRVVAADGKTVMRRSAERYLRAIGAA